MISLRSATYSCQGQIRAPHPPHPQPFGVSVDKILLEYRKLLICVLSMVVFHLCGQRSWVAVTETTWPPALRCSLSSALLNMFASPSSKKMVVLPALSFPASLAATERWKAGFLTDLTQLLGCSWSAFPLKHFYSDCSCLCLGEIQYYKLLPL